MVVSDRVHMVCFTNTLSQPTSPTNPTPHPYLQVL